MACAVYDHTIKGNVRNDNKHIHFTQSYSVPQSKKQLRQGVTKYDVLFIVFFVKDAFTISAMHNAIFA